MEPTSPLRDHNDIDLAINKVIKLKSNSTIGKTRKNEEQKEKEINRFALKLHSIMFINYDSFKPFYERVEKEKERTRSSSYRFL